MIRVGEVIAYGRYDFQRRSVLQRGALRRPFGRGVKYGLRGFVTSVAIFVIMHEHVCDDIALGFSNRLQRPITFSILLANLHTSFFCSMSHELYQHEMDYFIDYLFFKLVFWGLANA